MKRTWRIVGNSLAGRAYWTGSRWHWSEEKAKTWKTETGATLALGVLRARGLCSGKRTELEVSA